ncbi:MAG: hypothetical protein RL148_1463 [Planctomycetota bacterium]|jgi:hypothetical protein
MQPTRAILLSLFAFAPLATAQAEMTIGAKTLTPGAKVEIRYTNVARAHGSVTLEIDDGRRPVPTVLELSVQLDGKGTGSVVWVVPTDWDLAKFNAPGVKEQVCFVRDTGAAPRAR